MKNLILLFSLIFLITMQNVSSAFEEAASIDLIKLVFMGYTDGVKKMLDAGKCDVNYTDENGDTALSVAAENNKIEIMQLLIEHGADLDVGIGRNHLMRCALKHENQDMILLIANPTQKKKENLLFNNIVVLEFYKK